MYTAVGTYYSF